MTARQLAARMQVAPSRVPVIEQAEVSGATTLRTLRNAAAAMNCAFVYAFVPIVSLEEMVRERAMQKVWEDISRLNHTMQLENQALLESDLDAERQRMVDQIVFSSLRGLWDDR
jgi:predicted DNA-binding mobile mystery protein A